VLAGGDSARLEAGSMVAVLAKARLESDQSKAVAGDAQQVEGKHRNGPYRVGGADEGAPKCWLVLAMVGNARRGDRVHEAMASNE
jgi:hypothetical protein